MVVREFHSGNAEFTSGLELLRLINVMEPSLMRREMRIDAWVMPKNRAGIRKKKPQVPVYNYQIINNKN